MAAIFTEVYRENAWLNPESRSGPGSTIERGRIVQTGLERLIAKLGVLILLDAPCGDFNWLQHAPLTGVHYLGVDVVHELVAENTRRHGQAGREFRLADITRDALPACDLILCRDALVHFSDEDVWRALRVFQQSGSRYLATTTFPAQSRNEPIPTGSWRPLNLELAPFRFPPPFLAVTDGCPHPGYTDKLLAVWQLEDLVVAAPGQSRP
ncbi:MAG: class I SAM-dependent methyltransferase [Chthoniobacter sp.]